MMTCLCLEGACLSIWVWCGRVGGVEPGTEELECFVLTEPSCLSGSEVTVHSVGDSEAVV